MMEAVRNSETSINFYQTTWCNIPKDSQPSCHLFGHLAINSVYFTISFLEKRHMTAHLLLLTMIHNNQPTQVLVQRLFRISSSIRKKAYIMMPLAWRVLFTKFLILAMLTPFCQLAPCSNDVNNIHLSKSCPPALPSNPATMQPANSFNIEMTKRSTQ
jgi:hypothetical protein